MNSQWLCCMESHPLYVILNSISNQNREHFRQQLNAGNHLPLKALQDVSKVKLLLVLFLLITMLTIIMAGRWC